MGVRGHYTFSLTLDKGHFITELLRGSSLQPVLSGYCIFFEEQESCSSLNGLISADTAVIK